MGKIKAWLSGWGTTASVESSVEFMAPNESFTKEERYTAARQLKANPLWPELFRELRSEAVKMWGATDATDTVGREFLWKHFIGIGLLEKRVDRYLANASMDAELEERGSKSPQPKRDGNKIR